MNYKGNEYYYIRNGQNDIVGLFDSIGTQVVNLLRGFIKILKKVKNYTNTNLKIKVAKYLKSTSGGMVNDEN